MNVQLAVYAFFAIWIGGLLFSIARNTIKAVHQAKVDSKKSDKGRKPLVSVILYAKDTEGTIEESLASLARSTYKKLQVLVLDNASSDATKQVVRTYIKNKSKQKYQLISKRKSSDREVVVREVVKKQVKGEYVFLIDGRSKVDPESIASAVQYMTSGETKDFVLGKTYQSNMNRLGSLIKGFEQLLAFRFRQFGMQSYWSDEVRYNNALYKASYVKTHFQNDTEVTSGMLHEYDQLVARESESLKASDWIAHRKGLIEKHAQVDIANLAGRSLMYAFELIMISYFLYLAVFFQIPQFFALTWILLSGTIAFAAVTDSVLTIQEKRSIILLAPLALVVRIVYLWVVLSLSVKATTKLAFDFITTWLSTRTVGAK